MARPTRPPSREIERIPENLYRDPVDFLLADHYRQRMMCDILDLLLRRSADDRAACAAAALDYLEHELPHHVRDEEIGLFPRLKRRCPVGEDIRTVIGLLSEEHQKDEHLTSSLIAELRTISEKSEPADPERFARLVANFADSLRRHLTWEDATVLRLARAWLTPEDLVEIGREMAKRRGASYPD
jgi:hemerythrin-like domain-containing protein